MIVHLLEAEAPRRLGHALGGFRTAATAPSK